MAILTTYAQFRATFATSATIGTDGFLVWPGAEVEPVTGLMMEPEITSFPHLIQVDDTQDPSPGVDRYDWYVSQRTDDPAKQYLTVARNDSLPQTYSGQVVIGLTALAVSLLFDPDDPPVPSVAFDPPLTPAQILALFTDVDVYVQDKATNAIQHLKLLEVMTGDA